MANIEPQFIEANYVPLDVIVENEKPFTANDTPQTNTPVVAAPVEWSEVGGVNKPEDGATKDAQAVYDTYVAGSKFLTNEFGFLGSDGKMYHTDGLTSELDDRITGVSVESINIGDVGKFQIKGLASLTGLTAGTKYYAKVPTPTGVTGTTVDTYNACDEGDSFCGQTFKVATTKPITHIRVRLYLSAGAAASNLALNVYATSGGVPTGGVLATSTGYTPSLTESAANIDFYFATPFVPTVGVTYCFVSSGTSTGYVRCVRSSSAYGDGTAITQVDGGAWSAEADDLVFSIYQGTGELATTGSAKLVGIARTTKELSLRI